MRWWRSWKSWGSSSARWHWQGGGRALRIGAETNSQFPVRGTGHGARGTAREIGSQFARTNVRRVGGLDTRAQAPFALATSMVCPGSVDATATARCCVRTRAWAGERVSGPPALPAGWHARARIRPATSSFGTKGVKYSPAPRSAAVSPAIPEPRAAKHPGTTSPAPAARKSFPVTAGRR